MKDEMYTDQTETCIEDDSLNRFLDEDHSDLFTPTAVDPDYEEHQKEREDAWQEKIIAGTFSKSGSTIKMLPLKDGSVTIVDARDYPTLSEFNWSRGSDGSGRMYVYRYESQNGSQKKIYLHRVVARGGEGDKVDHLDGDSMNNCRSNLRLTDSRGNAQNKSKLKVYKNGKVPTSLYKGVCWDRSTGKWFARIYVHGKQIYLGRFMDQVKAAKAYDAAAMAMFKVPRLNFDYPEPLLRSA